MDGITFWGPILIRKILDSDTDSTGQIGAHTCRFGALVCAAIDMQSLTVVTYAAPQTCHKVNLTLSTDR